MITLENITVSQGRFVLPDVSISIPEGQYAVLMGGTGSGKTTILEVVCGLRTPDRGRVLLCGDDVTNLRPADRDVGYVPQDGALFKTMTVFDQLAFALVIRGRKAGIIRERVHELAELLSIDHLLDRSPDGLSGGECQRIALGRALSFKPGILLLDEPLSALDDDTRDQIMALLKNVQKHTGVTTLHVTHNLAEAQQLGEIMLRIDNGKVQVMDVTP
jgi:ABC-type sugar transport system ATPase subunit